MPDFEITAPDGKAFVVTAPEGATQEDAMAHFMKSYGGGQSISVPRSEQTPIDSSREVGFAPRLAASFKMTPEGKIDALKSMGYDIVTDGTGQHFVKEKGSLYPVNMAGFTAGDIADYGGDIAQVIPTLAAGSNPVTAAAAGGAGSAVRQMIGAMVPGNEDVGAMSRVGHITADAAMAGAGQAGMNKVLGGTWSGAPKTLPSGEVTPGGIDQYRPGNILAKMVQDKQGTAVGRAGEDIAKETGIDFTPGQLSQSKGLLTIEGMLRRHPMSADRWTAFDQEQLAKGTQYLNSALEMIKPGEVGPSVAGGAVGRAFEDVLTKAQQARRVQAASDFGTVDALTNGAEIIPTNNVRPVLDKLIQDLDVAGGGDTTATLVSRLKSIRSDLAGKPERIIDTGQLDPVMGGTIKQTIPAEDRLLTASQTARLLGIWGEIARGTGNIVKDVPIAQQRRIGTEVFKALQRDLDEAALSGGGSANEAQAAQALKIARDNYKANSQVVNGITESTLGRIFGNIDPLSEVGVERVAEKFKTMRPTEIVESFKLLDKGNPDAAQSVKRYLIEDAMKSAGSPLPGSMAPQRLKLGEDAFSPARFLSSMQNHPVWATLAPQERFEVTTAFRAMERLAENAGTGGSPTGPLSQAWDIVKTVFGGSLNPKVLAGGATSMLAPGKATDALLTPEGRKALVTISTTRPGTKNFAGSMAYLSSLIGTE